MRYRRAVHEDDQAGASLHVFIEFAKCVPEDAIKHQPGIWQYILPAPEEDPHAWALVPALLKHALVHIRVCLHNGMRAGPPFLYGLQSTYAACWPGVCHGVQCELGTHNAFVNRIQEESLHLSQPMQGSSGSSSCREVQVTCKLFLDTHQ